MVRGKNGLILGRPVPWGEGRGGRGGTPGVEDPLPAAAGEDGGLHDEPVGVEVRVELGRCGWSRRGTGEGGGRGWSSFKKNAMPPTSKKKVKRELGGGRRKNLPLGAQKKLRSRASQGGHFRNDFKNDQNQ